MGDCMNLNKITVIVLVITLILGIINSYQLSAINVVMPYMQMVGGNEGGAGNAAPAGSAALAGDITPKGIPSVYGNEIGFSFDDITPYDQNRADKAIRKLSTLDISIALSGKEKERYVEILFNKHGGTSCEYCCGAKAIIFENGEPACGCAHSYAMRGLAKYLITKHGSEFTDDQILEEVGKLKTLFFPAQIQQKAAVLKTQGIELTYANLASNKYRGIEQGKSSGGGMVGGC